MCIYSGKANDLFDSKKCKPVTASSVSTWTEKHDADEMKNIFDSLSKTSVQSVNLTKVNPGQLHWNSKSVSFAMTWGPQSLDLVILKKFLFNLQVFMPTVDCYSHAPSTARITIYI